MVSYMNLTWLIIYLIEKSSSKRVSRSYFLSNLYIHVFNLGGSDLIENSVNLKSGNVITLIFTLIYILSLTFITISVYLISIEPPK